MIWLPLKQQKTCPKVSSNSELTQALDIISGSFYKNEITDDVIKTTLAKNYKQGKYFQ